MYPKKYRQPNLRLLKKGTTICIAGFKDFVLDNDEQVHSVLIKFTRKQYPNHHLSDNDVIHCFSDMEPDQKGSVKFGHTLYD